MGSDFTVPKFENVEVDMNGGFLCMWTLWRPDPAAPDPEMPGLKQHTAMYHPVAVAEKCLCGSGKSYGTCCRRLPYWRPACPNPGLHGYALLAPQSVTVSAVDGGALRDHLMDDLRLDNVEDSPDRVFWTFWGEPALETEFGTACFGDVELSGSVLNASALSAPRMNALLDLLELSGSEIEHDPIPVFDKRTHERYELPPPKSA